MTMALSLLSSILTPLFWCLLLSPLVIVAYWQTQSSHTLNILFFVIILVIDIQLLAYGATLLPWHLGWNWQGQIAEALFALGLLCFSRRLSFSEAGFTFKLAKSAVRPIAFALLIFISINASLTYGNAGFPAYNPETTLFEATLPGISEELMFRGILLGLLNQALARQWTFFGAHVGWGLVIISVLFGMGHGIRIDQQLHVMLNYSATLKTGILGLLLGWIKERSGSLLPGIIGHNLINVVATL